MNLGRSFSLKVSRSGVEVVFLVCAQIPFLHIREVVLFLYFTAIGINVRDIIVVDVDRAFALIDFVASEYFNIDPFLVLWKTKLFYCCRFFFFRLRFQ